MDVRYINPFVQSIKSVFGTMLQTEVTIAKPVVKSSEEHSADVSAVIGLSGDATGAVVLSFPMQTAVAVASKFAGLEITAQHPDFCDALGELANMVAGAAKSKLEGLRASISLPSVIVGKEHVVSHARHTPRLALPCECALGPFGVEVALRVEKQTNQPKAEAGTPAIAR